MYFRWTLDVLVAIYIILFTITLLCYCRLFCFAVSSEVSGALFKLCTQSKTTFRWTATSLPNITEGGGAEAPWSPQKCPPSLRICELPPGPAKLVSQPHVTSPSLPPFCLHAPHFSPIKQYLAFISTKTLFLKSLNMMK